MKILSRILALTAKTLNKQERLSTQRADVKSASPQKPVEPRMVKTSLWPAAGEWPAGRIRSRCVVSGWADIKLPRFQPRSFTLETGDLGVCFWQRVGRLSVKEGPAFFYNRREGRPALQGKAFPKEFSGLREQPFLNPITQVPGLQKKGK